ncbi:integrase arm-type DNA-binding domain-containing protein [Novosphingobium sp. FKTRR1]|uniref:tyrosine-type recombinase/integrase n=1 Tax=Novosphingobium sp. FKTRR1 TaxID=2879118 RepID=UPI001CEFB464|nr:integrase arm-type DNA-binding domain-containing protein [Novosphingobium sp. FKTRR1]
MEVKAFPLLKKTYRKTDEKGLYLEVRPNGSKLWFFKYRHQGAEKRIGLGAWPDVSLAEARERRDAARKTAQDGSDPLHLRKMDKIAAKVSGGNTFQSVGEDFIKVRMEGTKKAAPTIKKARWYLAQFKPALGNRPIADIEPGELLLVLKQIEARGTHYSARRARAFASRVFRHGVATTLCKNDPAALLSDALTVPAVKHHAAITDPGLLGAFLRAVESYTGGPIVQIAMRLLPHIFLRPGEMRHGKWEEVDWDMATWTIPAERTKLRRPHTVPLSRQVIALLRELERHTGSDGHMFPGQRTHLRPMSENALNPAFRRMGFGADEITSHGLRATASTLLNESGLWQIDAIERALAHGHSNAVRGTYARGQHWEERVQMAQWWSDYLDKLKAGAVILPFHKATSEVSADTKLAG